MLDEEASAGGWTDTRAPAALDEGEATEARAVAEAHLREACEVLRGELDNPGGYHTRRVRRVAEQLTKRVLETALEGEITDHHGYEKHDAKGRGSSNSRSGTCAKTVLTDVGAGRGEGSPRRGRHVRPQTVKKRQRRLAGVDEMVLSLSAKRLTHGDISEHLAEVYGAEVSKQNHPGPLGDTEQGRRAAARPGSGQLPPQCGRLRRERNAHCLPVLLKTFHRTGTRGQNMPGFTALLQLDVAGLETFADEWATVHRKLKEPRPGFHDDVVQPLHEDHWRGKGGRAAQDCCDRVQMNIDALDKEVRALRKFLDTEADGATGRGGVKGLAGLKLRAENLQRRRGTKG
ncbi:transposase [Streptomyces flavidovirens]|uniref:transposase n=1 Tax=Streptomyces flavidovirens TaxID=67298 RepID=UPI0033AC4F4C